MISSDYVFYYDYARNTYVIAKRPVSKRPV